MPQLIDQLYYELTARDTGFRSGMDGARQASDRLAGSLEKLERTENREAAAAQRSADAKRRAAQNIGALGQQSGGASRSLGGLRDALQSTVGRTLSWVAALEAARRTLTSSVANADNLDKSLRRLSATSRILDVPIEKLQELSRIARDEFKTTAADAGEFASVFATFALGAGDIGLAAGALRSFLDLGAARGLAASQTLLAVSQALRGIDEGTDKLFAGKNPTVLWKEYADSLDRTVGSLSEAEKKLAILTAGLREGAKVQGEAQKVVESSLGAWTQFKVQITDVTTDLGRILQPVRTLGVALLQLPLLPVQFLLKGTAEAIRSVGDEAESAERRTGGFLAQAFRNATAPRPRVTPTIPTLPEVVSSASESDSRAQIDNLAKLIDLGLANNQQMAAARQLLRDFTAALDDANLSEADRVKLGEARKTIEEALNGVTERRTKAQKEAAAAAAEEAKSQQNVADQVRGLSRELASVTAGLTSRALGQFVALAGELEDRFADLPDAVGKAFGPDLQNALREARFEDLAVRIVADLDFPDDINKVELRGLKESLASQLSTAFAAGPEEALRVIREIEKRVRALNGAAQGFRAAQQREADKARAAADAKREADEALRSVRDQADAIGDAARGALQLADAFGAVSDETRRILDGVISITQGLPALLKTLELFKAVDDLGNRQASLLQLATAALPVIGGIASFAGGLFGGGPSPEEQERKRREEENTEAIRRLTDTINAFSDVTSGGAAFATARDTLNSKAIQDEVTRSAINRLGGLRAVGFVQGKEALSAAELAKFGITLEEFARLAQDAGIAVSKGFPTLKDITAVGEALRAQEFNRFADSFAGQLDRITRGFQILGTTDPADQFAEILGVLTDRATGAPALFDALRGLDVGTAAGRRAAESLLQGLFRNFGDITPERFGALGPEELLNVVSQLVGLLGQTSGADALAEALSDLEDGFRVFGVTDPGRQAKAFLETLSDFSPLLGNLLDTLDLSSAQGLVTAREILRGIYGDAKAGRLDLESAGLSLQDLISGIGRIDAAIPGVAGGTSESFSIDRSITTQGGDRIAGLLGTGNIFLAEIAASTRAMALAVGAEGLQPPVASGVAVLAPGGGTTVIALTVNGSTLTSGTLSPDLQSAIRSIADQLLTELLLQERGV